MIICGLQPRGEVRQMLSFVHVVVCVVCLKKVLNISAFWSLLACTNVRSSIILPMEALGDHGPINYLRKP